MDFKDVQNRGCLEGPLDRVTGGARCLKGYDGNIKPLPGTRRFLASLQSGGKKLVCAKTGKGGATK